MENFCCVINNINNDVCQCDSEPADTKPGLFLNQFGTLDEPFYVTIINPESSCGLQLLQLFSRMLQLCSAAKLQKCVVD